MRELFGLMCVKNEASSYLARNVRWHTRFLDLFVFDDQSTDDSVQVAENNGAVVRIRDNDQLTFMEHEGAFRQAAWNAFQEIMKPEFGDWVLAIDADEFFVASGGSEEEELLTMAKAAEYTDRNAHTLKVVEVFDVIDDVPYHRVDGWWDQILAPRFFRYEPGGRISAREMACGSVPTYVNPTPGAALNSYLLHYGYASDQLRQMKHARYVGKADNGHNPIHIDSILRHRDVRPWPGKIPS
jgi:glycosyltransferase involved in cell wall biosynthesis